MPGNAQLGQKHELCKITSAKAAVGTKRAFIFLSVEFNPPAPPIARNVLQMQAQYEFITGVQEKESEKNRNMV
jgi:hypothetical protein